MELDGGNLFIRIIDAGSYAFGISDLNETVRQFFDGVAVAHKNLLFCIQSCKERACRVNGNFDLAVFGFEIRHDLAAEMVVYELHAVADTKCRDAEVKKMFIVFGSTLFPDAGGAAGENHSAEVF